jgi:hypothetical protein
VLRDRNLPSILAWNIYNECNPCIPYAVRAARICRELDPRCRLSFADCSGRHDEVKAMVAEAKLSWYGINVYDYRPGAYVERAAIFQDRPVIFTEWGGVCAQGNLRVLGDLCDMFARQTRADASPRIAGSSFWVWADYEERSRPGPAAIDGWTIEGLVDRDGRPKPDLQVLSLMCRDIDHPPAPAEPVVELLARAPRRGGQWESVALDGVAGDQAALEARVAARRSHFAWREPDFGTVPAAGIDFRCRRTPLLLGRERPEVVIPVGRRVRAVAVLGHVALQGGYPASAVLSVHHRDAEPLRELGSKASEYVFEFEDGEVRQELLHGVHILRANNICRWWMTAPRSPETAPAAQAVLHPSYEVLRLDEWERAFPGPRFLDAVRWRLTDGDSIQAMYALSVLVG